MNPNSLLVYAGNPTQYHSPLFRAFAASPDFDIEVMFGDEIGAKPFYNPEVASVIEWDVPVLEGYSYRFFHNRSPSERKGFWSRNNPSMISYVWRSKSRYVMIHGYDTISAWYVYFTALFSGKKIIWRGETIEPKGGGRRHINLIKSIVLPLYFRGCHKVLYSCIANREYLTKFLRGQVHKLVSFPCAVDNAFFDGLRVSDPKKIKEIRAEHNIPDDHMVIASCSRLTTRKRADVIIRAISNMNSDKVSFLLIGDGPERQNLQNLADSLGVHLVVAGFVGQKVVAKLLSIADVFSLLSTYDASPKALNEAMNFPLAMVVSDGVGTARDMIKDGLNGYFFRDGDEELIVGHFNMFLEQPDKRMAMANENANIIKNYTMEIDVTNLKSALADGS